MQALETPETGVANGALEHADAPVSGMDKGRATVLRSVKLILVKRG
jgi:hypothetical protein